MKTMKISYYSVIILFAVLVFSSCGKTNELIPSDQKTIPYQSADYYVIDGDTIGGNGGGFQVPVDKK